MASAAGGHSADSGAEAAHTTQLPVLAAFGYLRSRAHSVYPCIATHVLLDLTGVASAATMSA